MMEKLIHHAHPQKKENHERQWPGDKPPDDEQAEQDKRRDEGLCGLPDRRRVPFVKVGKRGQFVF